MAATLKNIAAVLQTNFVGNDHVIEHLLTDSRKLTSPATSLFFALDGPRRNGHLFIEELYKKGLRHFVISQHINEQQYADAVFLKVANTLKALQQLAAQHRALFDIEVIGITGSNGKTVVKEWLYQLLNPDKNIVRSPKSYNSQIGVPLSVWKIESRDELAIFEAGISQTGEMKALEKIIQPTIGVLTNIGAAHSEGFKSDDEKLQEKLKLFTHAKVVIANGDNELIKSGITGLGLPAFFWGRNGDVAFKISQPCVQQGTTSIEGVYKDNAIAFDIPFTDAASIENAITCCSVLLYMGYDAAVVAKRMKLLQPVNMRLEYKKGINNAVIINDSYSADVNSLSIAFDFLRQQAGAKKKILILSDFAGTMPPNFYKELLRQILNYHIHYFVGIGEKLQAHVAPLTAGKNFKADFYTTTEDFLQHFQSSEFAEAVVLVKGARIFGFEKIVTLLEQKQHQTILEISLDAIAHNLKIFQSQLRPATKIMVMVKAFAYGSGSAEVAGVLQYHKADYLGVAYADEGVELRKAGITLPIMVMNAEETAFEAITENNLEPDLYSFPILEAFVQHLQKEGLKNYPVHIEIETGMNRLGFAVHDIDKLAAVLKDEPAIKVQSVFSHLVASEDAAEDSFTLHQYELLKAATEKLTKVLGYSFLKHIANTAAIVRHPQLQLDMVRLGIGLYGIVPNDKNVGLEPALTLRSTISQLKRISKGETVSYNRRGLATADSLIATVRIGYADGYSRRLGYGNGKMLVHGRLAPVIGTVCMDMVMIDVTHIPNVHEGDDVIVFGKGLPVQQVAGWMDTIPYEVMTGISQRVKRVYYGEG